MWFCSGMVWCGMVCSGMVCVVAYGFISLHLFYAIACCFIVYSISFLIS